MLSSIGSGINNTGSCIACHAGSSDLLRINGNRTEEGPSAPSTEDLAVSPTATPVEVEEAMAIVTIVLRSEPDVVLVVVVVVVVVVVLVVVVVVVVVFCLRQ